MKSVLFNSKGFLFITFMLPLFTFAQRDYKSTQDRFVALLNLIEEKYPVNDEFINGTVYPLPNGKIPGNPYLNDDLWHSATLFINNMAFPGELVKYDLIIDELIIKTKIDDNIERLITINKSQVDSFYLGSSCFVNSRNLFPEEKKNTYCEKVFRGRFSVYKLYQKTFIDMYTSSTPFGKFSDQKSNTYLFNNNKLTNINSFKSFLAIFEKPEHEKIRKFLKSNNINYKKISNAQMVELMVFCSTFISN